MSQHGPVQRGRGHAEVMQRARTSADGDAPHDEAVRDVCVAAYVGAAADHGTSDVRRVEHVRAAANACEVADVGRALHPHHTLLISAPRQQR